MSPRVGIILRSTARGLATQSQEAWHGFPFEAALHVLDGDPLWPEHLWVSRDHRRIFDAHLTEDGFDPRQLEPFLSRVDVVFSIETLYHDSLVRAMRQRGIASVVQGNCELWRGDMPPPTQWVWPTSWRLDGVPDGPTIPVPTTGRSTAEPGALDGPLVVLHVAGHRAVGDRNGTDLMLEALRQIQTDVTVRIIGQDGPGTIVPPRSLGLPSNVELDVCETGVGDRWSMYDGAHLCALPRRYGGLCLPALEALESGVVPLMPNVEPNYHWPVSLIQAPRGHSQRVRYGVIETCMTHPRALARRIDEFNYDRAMLAEHRERALEWARNNSWQALGHIYRDLFASVAS